MRLVLRAAENGLGGHWPIHDIANVNIVWCMAYESGVRERLVQCVRVGNRMWAMQVSNKRMHDSYGK